MPSVTIGQDSWKLFLAEPLWGESNPHRVTRSLETVIAKGQLDAQCRWSVIEAARTKVQYPFQLLGEDAVELRSLLKVDPAKRWAIPMWDSVTSSWDELKNSVFASDWVINFGAKGWEVMNNGGTPQKAKYESWAPLLFCRLENYAEIKLLTPNFTRKFELVFKEDSSYSMRLGTNAWKLSSTDYFPDIDPTWQNNISTASDMVELIQVGNGRESMVEGADAPVREGQDCEYLLTSRVQIRELLTFWESRMGRLNAFQMPKVYAPDKDLSQVMRCHFASDEIELIFTTPAMAKTRLRVWERPVEGVDAVEPTKAKLIEFEYRIPSPLYYRFTDFERELQGVNNTVYQPGPFEVGDMVWSLITEQSKLSLKSFCFEGNPLMKYIPEALEGDLGIRVYECEVADVFGTQKLLWAGEVDSVDSDGQLLDVNCLAFGGDLEQVIPRAKVGPGCWKVLFEPICGADEPRYRRTGRIVGIDGTRITIAGVSVEDDYFRLGKLHTGFGENFERREIVAHTGNQIDTVKPLRNAVVGQVITLWPGCDGQSATCRKFNNYINFGGFEKKPNNNISVKAVEVDQQVAKK